MDKNGEEEEVGEKKEAWNNETESHEHLKRAKTGGKSPMTQRGFLVERMKDKKYRETLEEILKNIQKSGAAKKKHQKKRDNTHEARVQKLDEKCGRWMKRAAQPRSQAAERWYAGH